MGGEKQLANLYKEVSILYSLGIGIGLTITFSILLYDDILPSTDKLIAQPPHCLLI